MDANNTPRDIKLLQLAVAKLHLGQQEINRKLDILLARNAQTDDNNNSAESFEPATSLEELDNPNDPKQRAYECLKLVMDGVLLLKISWSGRGKTNEKIPMAKYRSILQFIKEVAGDCTEKDIKNWMQLKLNHADNMFRSKKM